MTIVYKEGKTLEGYGKILGENRIKFWHSNKSKPVKWSYKDLKSVNYIKIHTNNKTLMYQFVRIDDTRIKLLKLTVSGAINLYERVTNSAPMYMAGGGMNGMGYWSGGGTINNYYVKRKGEVKATHLGSNQLFTKNFKKAMSEYVKDCNELVVKIQNKEYKKKHLEQIVEYYNSNCSN
ncbi:hypothetical protein ACFQ1O_04795 [Pseudofulvibacter geojedonensis]|uniref:Uncharacterized protein n=2 Tax=Pseudofulvibacter geojedonensis TaxID=1123758 RepID=A0ABW3I181_9FLAO